MSSHLLVVLTCPFIAHQGSNPNHSPERPNFCHESHPCPQVISAHPIQGVRTKSIWTKSIVYTQTKSIGYRTKSISHIFLYKHLCDIYLSNMNCISVIFQYFKAFFTLQDSVRDFCTHICFNVGLGINII